MAYDTYPLDEVVTPAGTLKMTLYIDDNWLSGDIPTTNLKNIGDIIEKIEENVGIIEMGTLDVEMFETYSATYLNGFWLTLINWCLSNNYPMPELWFTLSESGDKYLFSGVIDAESVEHSELYINGSTVTRTVLFTLIQALYRLKTDIDAFITELLDFTHGIHVEKDLDRRINNAVITPTAGIETYKYRIAARDANNEYCWGNELTVNNATFPILINWIAEPLPTGATDFAVYRTYASDASSLGFLGNTGGATNYTDTGAGATGGAVQSKLSAPRYIKFGDIFRMALHHYFGETIADNLLDVDSNDIYYTGGGYDLNVEGIYIELWKNYGNVTTPNMQASEYFNSNQSAYLGNSFSDVLSLLGNICQHFVAYMRLFYDNSLSKNRIAIWSRTRYASKITVIGSLKESDIQQRGSPYVEHLKVIAKPNSDCYYDIGNQQKDIDYTFTQYWLIDQLADSTGVPVSLSQFEKMFRYVDGTYTGYGTLTELTGAKYYDYILASLVTIASTYNKAQEAMAKYYYGLASRNRMQVTRKYDTLLCTVGGSSFQNAVPLRRMDFTIYSTLTWYANEVKKNLIDNDMTISWIQE
jgi:hypothetical protein